MTAFRINSPATTGYGSVSIATPFKLTVNKDSSDDSMTDSQSTINYSILLNIIIKFIISIG